MSSVSERIAVAEGELRRAVEARDVPGLVAATGTGNVVEMHWAFGLAEEAGGAPRQVDLDTVFDLASLTKVMATLPAVLCLVRDGQVSLDEPVGGYFGSPAADSPVAGATVRQLLAHCAGFPEHREFYRELSGLDALVAAVLREPLEFPPGTHVAYSDLGFILLGALVNQVSGTELSGFAQTNVFEPLGMAARFNPPASWRNRCAATEIVDGAAICGRVHDENAAAAGGVAGHAGLFASIADVEQYAISWLDDDRAILPAQLRAEAMRCQTTGLNGARGLGWTCRGDRFDVLTPGWGPAAVSHTGFTGTSLALDPTTGRWAGLLTNAVHFGRGRAAVTRALRERFHAALVGDELPPLAADR
jgi:CubicO group peptidase (beta-lactamase class C family)